MRTLTWAAVMFMSPLTMKGLIVFAPIVVVAAHLRWTWWIALAIVAGSVSMASAETYHDEHVAMDLDTCNEHQGDVSEHFLQGWKVVKQEDKKQSSHWVYEKGQKEVHFICADGYSTIETKPIQPRGSVEYMK